MCKKISPTMALGFALQKCTRVSFAQLQRKRKKLLAMNDGYILDVSYRTIAKTVASYSDVMTIASENSSFFVVKTQTDGRIFETEHLKMCYRDAFAVKEFTALVRILTEA